MRRTAYPAGLLALALALSLAACDSAAPTYELGLDAAARPDGAGMARVDVCHYDRDADAFKLVTVAAAAVPALLRNGGGLPGGEVPGMEGYTFDEACAPLPDAPPVPACFAEAIADYNAAYGEWSWGGYGNWSAPQGNYSPAGGYIQVWMTSDGGAEVYAGDLENIIECRISVVIGDELRLAFGIGPAGTFEEYYPDLQYIYETY
jgi:hypothetical protein